MRVSVVLCTYSPDLFDDFVEAADSVLNQTYHDIELVIVVDGSQQLCEMVYEEYGDTDTITIHCNDTNKGLLASRNLGVEISTGDIVAFIDDDAVADSRWIEQLVDIYEQNPNAIAAGGKMIPQWVSKQPIYLPEEFYWLIGVTHKGFAHPGAEVRNTFGSNISFRRGVFEDLGGFEVNLGGRKAGRELQAGETELCVRMQNKYNQGVIYQPEAVVAHKIFEFRTRFRWLMKRAFWQGYSKRAMAKHIPESGAEERDYLSYLIQSRFPHRFYQLLRKPNYTGLLQLLSLTILTFSVGTGYLYGMIRATK